MFAARAFARFGRRTFASAAAASTTTKALPLILGTGALTAYAGSSLFSEYSSNKLLNFPVQASCAGVPMVGLPGTKHERTFIAVKPDGVQRGIIGNIISRFEAKGFKLVAMKLIWPSKEMAEGHYADLSKKPFFPGLVKFFSSGPVCAMVWEGKGAVKTGRVMLGETNPAASLPGSIRGDLCVEVGRNICHGSDSTESAAHEISFWFTEKEVYDYNQAQSTWVYEK